MNDAEAKSQAPEVPPETCPICDALRELVGALSDDLTTFCEGMNYNRRSTIDKADVREIVHQTVEGMATVRLRIEELRNANDMLRNSGRYWRMRARALADTDTKRKD